MKTDMSEEGRGIGLRCGGGGGAPATQKHPIAHKFLPSHLRPLLPSGTTHRAHATE